MKPETAKVMTIQKTAIIDPLSLVSLRLKVKTNGQDLSVATGFVVNAAGRNFLITNWHVVSGRHPQTDKPSSPTGGIPDELEVIVHQSSELGKWGQANFRLRREDGTPLWIEHPAGRNVDVVALSLQPTPPEFQLYPMDLALADVDMLPKPGMPVFIIGFPMGITSFGAFPIWKTGHVASDHDLDYRHLPSFLIDATTRGGMSGSPVVVRPSGSFQSSKGWVMTSRMPTRFLGVYSGRVLPDSEIGIVWKPEIITQILRRVVLLP